MWPKSCASPNFSASALLRTPWPLPSEAWSSSRNRARKIGICSRIGRHEANGLVPLSLYSFIVSWASFSRSCPNFFCSSLTLGWINCMLRLDLICLTNSGISAIRITRVRPMIERAHAAPPDGSKPDPLHSLWKPTSTTEIA